MTNFLMIENTGIADKSALLLLGASTARGHQESIGQFGSGAKLGIVTALRFGCEVVVTLGHRRLEFVVGDDKYQQIFIKEYNSDEHNFDELTRQSCVRRETSMSLGFGVIDWTDIRMAVREFISNALDSCGGRWDQIQLDFVDKPRGADGVTRVFVSANDEIRQYVANIEDYFLHASEREQQGCLDKSLSSYLDKDLSKEKLSPVRIYRKGVFVNSLEVNSIYDYNDAKGELKIDESRKLDSYSCRSLCTKVLCKDSSALDRVLRILANRDSPDEFEAGFSWIHLNWKAVAEAVKRNFGEEVGVTSASYIHRLCVERDKPSLLLPDDWARAAWNGEAVDAVKLLSSSAAKGLRSVAVPQACTDKVAELWGRITDLAMDGGKEMPRIECFVSHMSEGKQLNGYWDPNEPDMIALHVDHCVNTKTILEELAHYVSEADDCSRDFQDWILRFSSRLLI